MPAKESEKEGKQWARSASPAHSSNREAGEHFLPPKVGGGAATVPAVEEGSSVIENEFTALTLVDYALWHHSEAMPLLWSDEDYGEFLKVYGDTRLVQPYEQHVKELMMQFRAPKSMEAELDESEELFELEYKPPTEPIEPVEVRKGQNEGVFNSVEFPHNADGTPTFQKYHEQVGALKKLLETAQQRVDVAHKKYRALEEQLYGFRKNKKKEPEELITACDSAREEFGRAIDEQIQAREAYKQIAYKQVGVQAKGSEDIKPYDNAIFQLDDGPTMQLGFTSVAVLIKTEPSAYEIRLVMKEKSNGSGLAIDHSLDGQKVSRLFTTSISSCMFVALTNVDETYCVVMHLDSNSLMPMNQGERKFDTLSMDVIKEALRAAGVGDVSADSMFVSRVENEAEKQKEEAIAQAFGVTGPSPNKRRTTLNRGETHSVFSAQHEEIGVDFSSGEQVVFGVQGKPDSDQFLIKNIEMAIRLSSDYDNFKVMISGFAADILPELEALITPEVFSRIPNRKKEENTNAFVARLPLAPLLTRYREYLFRMQMTPQKKEAAQPKRHPITP